MHEPTIHPCARCAGVQRTCCQRAEIVLTTGDLDRIGRHTGSDDFYSIRPPENPDYLEPDEDDPNWAHYTIDGQGRRRMLKKKPAGDCTFLGPAGCILPMEVRPLVCRLYPFAYTERGLEGVDQDYCPTDLLLRGATPGTTMLTVLRMDPRDGTRWHEMLYNELRAERPPPCASE